MIAIPARSSTFSYETSGEISGQATNSANTCNIPASVFSLPGPPTKSDMPTDATKALTQDPTKSSGKRTKTAESHMQLKPLNETEVLTYSFDVFYIYLLLTTCSIPRCRIPLEI
ncbi:hypothetical protein ACH5RR_018505 [Cinchona calisaya]|uniref:Uncharacterized protein n=1 Tax=Cinchona calisaya TaxID=153742 RepID=A0ABD2ZLM6_9GENT